MAQKIRVIIKLVLFVVIFMLLILQVRDILDIPKGKDWAMETGMEEVRKHRNKYDVCFVGASTLISNINNQELYERYGIAGISVGEPAQDIFFARYTLEELLKFQKPRIVFLDASSLLYGEGAVTNWINDYEGVHSSLDAIKTIDTKWKVLRGIEQYGNEINVWNYRSRLYYLHENWKHLNYRNFSGYEMTDCMNGNIAITHMQEGMHNIYDASSQESVSTDEYIEKYFSDIVRMCDESETELIIIASSVRFTKGQHNAAQNLAQKNGIVYIDVNELIGNIGFNYNSDIGDINYHFNLSGAIKWTDYIGEFLSQNYEFTDRRNDKTYDWYKEQSDVFRKQKDMMMAKQTLVLATTFDEYLAKLMELNKSENMIFISAYDEATQSLDDNELELLKSLGLQTDLRGQYRSSYAAVISGSEVTEELSTDDVVIIEGSVDDISYTVKSGGSNSGNQATITIDGAEKMQKGRGFNIVVYNKDSGQVISSVYFDTYASTNPIARRFSATSTRIEQLEVDANVWENQ